MIHHGPLRCAAAKIRHLWLYGFRKCGSVNTRIRKSLRPWGTFPGEQSRKARVLRLPRTPKAEAVGHSSLSARHGSPNGLGTAQERIRLNGDAHSAFPPPLRCAPSRGHATVLSVSRTEERQKKPRDFSRGGVSHLKYAASLLFM